MGKHIKPDYMVSDLITYYQLIVGRRFLAVDCLLAQPIEHLLWR